MSEHTNTSKRKLTAAQQAVVTETARNPVIDALMAIKVDELGPLEAMTKLYELQRMARTAADAGAR